MCFVSKRKLVFVFALFVFAYIIYQILFASSREIYNIEKDKEVVKLKVFSKYRDWTDYEQIALEKIRKGFGEHGADVVPTDPNEIAQNEELYKKTGFSVVVSNKISVNRSLSDIVHPQCRTFKYFANLPKVSVIIIFHNEVTSVLLRTVHSVVNRTPPELLHEVILVNDCSTNSELYDPLKAYISKSFPSKVKIKNLSKRTGLIVTRMEGARAASGEVLTFIDSHVEVHFNWLPPLLQPIAENRRIATLPIIDYFDPFTFGYLDGQENFQGSRGVIDWYLDFHELPKLPKDVKNDLKPFPNPIMLGAAFAIDRTFFIEELGGYDEDLQIWNGENYELSFKLWMCADGLFTVPCSRVSHSFRSINPSRVSKDDYVARNFMRIAEVWLDEFKDLPKQLEPQRYAAVDSGDLTKQKALRESLKCKTFRWFLNTVAPDMIQRFPPLADPPKFASGSIQSVANPRLCLDNLGRLEGEKLGIVECDDKLAEPGVDQKFIYSFFKDIRQDHGRLEFCLDAWDLKMTLCNYLPYGNQFWTYEKTSREILLHKPDKKCLTLMLTNDTLAMEHCTNDLTQKWNFAYVNETAFKSFNETFGFASILNVT